MSSLALVSLVCAFAGDAEHASHSGASDSAAAQERARSDAWLARIHAGDDTAFAELFQTYVGALTRFAASHVWDDETASEIVSDVFFSVWEKRTAWSPEHGIAAYLFGAVRNRARTRTRDQLRATRFVQAAAREDHPPGVGLSLDETEREATAHLIEKVRRVVDTLPPARREAMMLRWEHGLTPEQIAAVMGVSKASVYHLLERSLKTLRDLFGNGLL
jgi:RNA polymerase sigma-70 factor (ECF subfamily)